MIETIMDRKSVRRYNKKQCGRGIPEPHRNGGTEI